MPGSLAAQPLPFGIFTELLGQVHVVVQWPNGGPKLSIWEISIAGPTPRMLTDRCYRAGLPLIFAVASRNKIFEMSWS